MNKNIISLSGDIASGKGTVSILLAEKLNFEIYRTGDYFRKLAGEMNMTLTEFNIYCETHKEMDWKMEENSKIYAESHDNLIIDARLGWFAVPHSFKVYLRVDLDEAAKRAYNDIKRKGSVETFVSLEQTKESIYQRYTLENERYFNLYNIKKDDMDNYDLVIDTTSKNPQEVAEIICTEFKKWIKNK